MKRVYVALGEIDPRADLHKFALEMEVRTFLTADPLAEHVEVVDELEASQVVVTSTDRLGDLPEELPESVELLHLTDCGGAGRYRAAPNLTVANAREVLDTEYAMAAAYSMIDALLDLRSTKPRASLQLGIIGLGHLSRKFLSRVYDSLDSMGSLNADPPMRVDRIVGNDIRTPEQGLMQKVARTFSELDVSFRRTSLDLLLTNSDIVFVAAYHGPTADPLIGAREARLIDRQSWVLDASEPGVVDVSGLTPRELGPNESRNPTANYFRVDAMPASTLNEFGIRLRGLPRKIATLISLQIMRWDEGLPIDAVEHVDYPTAGDPAFWSSLMNPRE